MGLRTDIYENKGIRPDLRKILLGLHDKFSVVQGSVFYVDAADGSNGNDGLSWDRPLLTMATAFTKVTSGDTIVVRGKIKEQITTPVQTFDINVIGVEDRPRHADTQPVDPEGRTHGATWTHPDSPTATTPLLKIIQQGWTFQNIIFDAPSDDTCIQLFANAASGNDERDASHAAFLNCKFANGTNGIEDVDGAHHVLVAGCEFNALTDGIITLSTGVRVPSYWTIEDSIFQGNTNNIKVSMEKGVIRRNALGNFTTKSLVTTQVSSQGGNNMIYENFLSGTYSIGGGYTGASTDQWFGNYADVTGGITQADPA